MNYFGIFVYRGSSHRRKSAACPKFDMVWLHRAPIAAGRRGVISRSNYFYLSSLRLEEVGGRLSPPVGLKQKIHKLFALT